MHQLVQIPTTAKSHGPFLPMHILVLSFILMLEITQLQHESDHALEGLKTIHGGVFLQDLFSVMRPNWLCGCTDGSAGTRGGHDNTWPVRNCSLH